MSGTGVQQKLCAFCGGDAAAFGGRLGRMEGPYNASKSSYEAVYVHHVCAVWSPNTSQDEQLRLRSVGTEVRRARKLRCSSCGLTGAASGCRVPSCSRCYHLPCAIKAGCRFNLEQYLMACPDHAALFRKEPTSQAADKMGGPLSHLKLAGKRHMHSTYPDLAGSRGVARSKVGKRNIMTAAQLGDHVDSAKAAYQSLVAELAAHADDSEPDEAVIMRKDAKRLRKAENLLAPKLLQPTRDPQLQQHQAALRQEQQRMQQWQPPPGGFAAVGGLADVKRQLKEMVLLPLAQPQLMKQLGIQPPRGILLHGPPGTGKTAIVRALATECAAVLSQCSDGSSKARPVALFARKGTDCLGSYAGDAELHLRLLFEMAAAAAPSIIFLDELDGLVPPRSVRSSSSDQIFASVVSVMLALMDGLHDRGQVLVIGATNRPDAIDPALRRPGRFDREVYFNLPSQQDRRDIIAVHTSGWSPQPPLELLEQVAAATEGWAGADLQSLVAGAVLAAVRRTSPHLLSAAQQQQRQQLCQDRSEQQEQQQRPQGNTAGKQLKDTCLTACGSGEAAAAGALQSSSLGLNPATQAESPETVLHTNSAAEAAVSHPEELVGHMQVNVSPTADAAPAAAGSADSGASPALRTGGFLAALSSYMAEQQQQHQPWLQPVMPVLPSPPAAVGQPTQTEAELSPTADAVVVQAAEQAAAPRPEPDQQQDRRAENEPRQQELANAAAAGTCCNQKQQQQQHQAGGEAPHHSAQAPVCRDGVRALPAIQVLPCDWAAALATAGPPASKREMSSLAGLNPAAPLPSPLVPLLLPAMAHVVLHLHSWLLLGTVSEQLAAAAAATAEIAALGNGLAPAGAASGAWYSELEALLIQHGAVEQCSTTKVHQALCDTHHAGAATSSSHLLAANSSSSSSRRGASAPSSLLPEPSGCHCLLLSGHGPCGQAELAAAVLALLGAASAAAVQIFTLPGMLLAGDGDVGRGLVSGMQDALSRVGQGQLLVLYMPRAELWALHAAAPAAPKQPARTSRGAWKNGRSVFSGGGAMDSMLSSSSSDDDDNSMDGDSSGTDGGDTERGRQQQHDPNNAQSRAAAALCTDVLPQRPRSERQQQLSSSKPETQRQRQQLSAAWSVFEQQLAMLSTSWQGVLLLATTHLSVEQLPDEMQQLFGGNVTQQQQQHHQWAGTPSLGRSGAVVQVCCCGGGGGGSSFPTVGTAGTARAAMALALDRATAAAVECYRHKLACQAASVQQAPDQQTGSAALARPVPETSGGSSQQPGSQLQHRHQQHVTCLRLATGTAFSSAATADEQQQMSSMHRQSAAEQQSGPWRCQQQQQPRQQPQESQSSAVKLHQLNAAQQDQAKQLFDQVQQQVQFLGSLLLKDPRMKFARAKQQQRRQASSAGVSQQQEELMQLAHALPLAAVCTKAVRGWFCSFDEYQAEFTRAANRIRQQHASCKSHSRSVAAAAALEDVLAVGCKQAAQQLKLYEPERVQWLHAVAEARKAGSSQQQHDGQPQSAEEQQQQLPRQLAQEAQQQVAAAQTEVLTASGFAGPSQAAYTEEERQHCVHQLQERLQALAAAQLIQWDRMTQQQQQQLQQQNDCRMSSLALLHSFCRMAANAIT